MARLSLISLLLCVVFALTQASSIEQRATRVEYEAVAPEPSDAYDAAVPYSISEFRRETPSVQNYDTHTRRAVAEAAEMEMGPRLWAAGASVFVGTALIVGAVVAVHVQRRKQWEVRKQALKLAMERGQL
eukprot:comp11416_c0_seq1/m.5807 comp11416_c0_seq1/g.5807  ORF comp11416_c0_seq1/g.5807 comp11416_c0_seq1/m.5807 type:complete len:130 (-) comp11416_c0_seq1:579-968(-)